MAERKTHKYRSATEKANAVGIAVVAGVAEASRTTGVPEQTLRDWIASPAFVELRTRKRDEVAAEVWAAFQTGVRRIVELLPRTEDLAKVAVASGVLYDKHALMSGEATSRTESRALTDDLTDTEKLRLHEWIVNLPAAAGDPEPAQG